MGLKDLRGYDLTIVFVLVPLGKVGGIGGTCRVALKKLNYGVRNRITWDETHKGLRAA